MTRYKSSVVVKYLASVAAVIGAVGSAQAEDGTKIGGFVDVGYLYNSDNTSDALRVNDGAVYLNHNAGKSSFTFDMPFSLKSGSNDFYLGLNKGQAFVRHAYGNGIGWRFGQFDGIFGLERNDTVNLVFATQGRLYATQAKTHAALEGSYAISDSLNLQLYVGGANSRGGKDSEDRPEMGGKVTLSGPFNVGVGGYFRKVADDTSMVYGNATVETKLFGVQLGAEASVAKAGEGDLALGGAVTGSYNVMTDLDAAVRANYLSKFDDHQNLEITAGVRYAMDKNLAMKLNYTLDNTTSTEGATAEMDHTARLAAVFGF